MQSISQLVTSKKKLVNSNLQFTSYKLTPLDIRDRALELAKGLTSTKAPNDMTAWYCKAYKTLGNAKYIQCVETCRMPGVKHPKKLFGYILKKEMQKSN